MQLQFLNTYPQAGGYIQNGIYHPSHGRHYYDSFMIWEAAREDARYGARWVNEVWTNATPAQQQGEYVIDRMIRLDSSGSPDKAGALKDLWGDMAKKLVTWDYERQQWLATANKPDDGSDWEFYQRCRTPLVRIAGAGGWYRPGRGHLPMEFGFNIIPLQATAGTTVSCNFAPHCDPVRQSDWRACLVAVNAAGGASYSTLWNSGTNSIPLSADQTKLYLVVIATPKPMKIAEPAWQAYLTEAGLQFPYAVSFTNAAPKNVIHPAQSRGGMVQHGNGGDGNAATHTKVYGNAIVKGTTYVYNTSTLNGPAIAANIWRHAVVVFSGVTCTLYLDGAAMASNAAMTLFPDALNAPLMENASYLGRGNAGHHFQGSLDDFRAYNKPLAGSEVASLFSTAAPAPVVVVAADTTAPAPNAAAWLVAPAAVSDSTVTMSATPGSDASGWVEYYFACLSGGGHDSGWVSFNKYTDVGLAPGATVSYTVRMRDRAGNTTAASAAASATLSTSTAGSASFADGPVGIANGQITMTATKVTSASGKVEYKFDRTSPSASSSGWQSSLSHTQTGLATGSSHSYTVTVRDGRGNTSAASAAVSALARDDAAPRMAIPVAHWAMQPYATIDNKVSMTAQAVTDPSGVEYFFHCLSGGGPDSAWQASTTFVTPVLADGTYVYQYKVRDKSPRNTQSVYSTSYPAKITPTTGYHAYTLDQVLTGADDSLVSFPATVMKVNADHYLVKDLATGSSIKVKPNTNALVTYPLLALKNVTVKGHLYTLSGERVVTFSTLVATGNPTRYSISGRVTNSSGTGIAGATVSFADVANASVSAIVTATTDASGNYSKGVTTGAWYVAVSSSAHNTSDDQPVAVNASGVSGVNFTLVANASVAGTVTLQNIPYAEYDVYLYHTHFPIGSGSLQAWTESENGTTAYGTNNRNHGHDWGDYVRYQTADRAAAVAQATSGGDGGGNWLKFTGLTDSNLTLTSSDRNAPQISGFRQRALAAIQIVDVTVAPPPADPFVVWQQVQFGDDWDNPAISAPDLDPDGDGKTNLQEFAFRGDPRDGSDQGLLITRLLDGSDGDSALEFTVTCAVRRGAVFSANAGNAQVSLPVDGVVYTIEGDSTLQGSWNTVVTHQGASESAPPGSGLPDLAGTGWQYHIFSSFNGLGRRGFLRAGIVKP